MCLLCPKQESNLQTLGFKPSRSSSWRIRARVVPDGLEPPLPGCRPGVVAAGPRDYPFRSGSRGTRTHNGVTAPVFKTGSSSGRMTSVYQVAGAGIEPTPERSERPVLPLDDPASLSKVRGAGLEPASPGSKPGSLPLADPRISALRESNPPCQVGSLAPLPLGQGHKAAAAGIEPASGRLTAAYPYQHGSHRKISQDGWI